MNERSWSHGLLELQPWAAELHTGAYGGQFCFDLGWRKLHRAYVPARRAAANGSKWRRHGASRPRECEATCACGRICFFRSLVAINCRRNKGVRETTESSCNPVRREQLIERMQGDRLNLAPVHGRLASTYAESTQLFHVRLRDSSRRENRLGVGPTILMQKKKKNMRCMARLSGRQSRARLHRTEEIKDITCDTGAERTIHLLGWR